ncbi:hypothetical protein BC830DRAFT_110605 [Chytriomyces sp. MP71]|nr:hypothetical protein BC830DRAFT_110605 [Chytriomyces sp. MP71]
MLTSFVKTTRYLDLHGIDQKHAYDFVKNRKSGEYGDHKRFYPDLIAISGVNRTCRQVYTYVVDVALNDNQERAGESWTIEDDVQLLELVQLKGHSWSKIEDELARVGAKERYRHLQSISEPLVTTGSWTREEEDSLVRLLVQHHKPDRTSTVPAPPPPPRLWFLLANELKTRNFWQIRDKFNNTGVKARWWAAALAVREEEMGASEGVDKADGEDRMNALVQDSRKIDLEWTRELDKKLLQGLKSQRTAHDETEISWKPFLHGPLAVWPLARIKDRWISLRNYVQLHAQRLASANEAASSVPGTMRKCILYCLKHYDEMAGSSEGVLDRSKMLVGVRSNLSQEFVVESEEEGERGLDAEGDDKTGEKRKEDKKNAKKAKRVIGLAEKGSRAMEKADGEVDMKSKRKKRKHMDAVDGGDGSKHVISVGEMKQSKKKRTSLIDEGSVNAKKEWDEEEVVEADQVTSYREVSRGKKGKT